jgi:hypothetical protein
MDRSILYHHRHEHYLGLPAVEMDSLDRPVTTASASLHLPGSSTIMVTPSSVRPLPKAGDRQPKKQGGGRKKLASSVLTLTPTKETLRAEQAARKGKPKAVGLGTRRGKGKAKDMKCKPSARVRPRSSSDDDDNDVNLEEMCDDDSDDDEVVEHSIWQVKRNLSAHIAQ